MKYLVDQTSAGIAKGLRKRGYECETVTKLILGHEDSRQRVGDHRIMRFLEEHRSEYTFLTADEGLAKDCEEAGLSVVRLPSPLPELDEILQRLGIGQPRG